MGSVRISAFLIATVLMANVLIILDGEKPVRAQTPPAASAKDVLIIDDLNKFAYFGWYRASDMNASSENLLGWDLLNRTVLWATSGTPPNQTKIVLFTYDGSCDPASDPDGKAVYDNLVAWGYGAVNITLHNQADIETLNSAYYESVHLVIYALDFPRNSFNVVESSIPFITFCVEQTDEMGIGTGTTTMHYYTSAFYVVSNNYYPTYGYPLGPLYFGDGLAFKATEAMSGAKVLVNAEVAPVGNVEMSITQTINILPDGNANTSLKIEIPDSLLADKYRETFFANISSLVPEVEYDIPEYKIVPDKIEVEETVRSMLLVGDINGDGKVDKETDIYFIASRFGAHLGDQRYDATADITGPLPLIQDSKINIRDVATAAKNYGLTPENTGHLHVTGYYNGTAVNCTDVYYSGRRKSALTNMSDVGHIWNYLPPGTYTVYGRYQTTLAQAIATVAIAETSYAQLDFGGALRPSSPQVGEPIKSAFYESIAMDQSVQLGFDTNVTESKILPFDPDNAAVISLNASSQQVAIPLGDSVWRVYVGPPDDNATNALVEFTFTQIQLLQQMLQSFPGDQNYTLYRRIRFELPSGAELLNVDSPSGVLQWTVDFGSGTYLEAQVPSWDLHGVNVTETMTVTEWDISAYEGYLNQSFSQYRKFTIDYLQTTTSMKTAAASLAIAEPKRDWSKTWTKTISLGTFTKEWTFGEQVQLRATIKATPSLELRFHMGWEFSWWKLKKFESWMQVTPSITVGATATASIGYTKTWSYTFATWSYRLSFWVGAIPVWANLRLTVTGKITLDAGGSISVSTGLRAYAWFKGGVKWDSTKGWQGIIDKGSGVEFYKPTLEGTAYLSVTPELPCRLEFLVYDVAGPFVQGTPYAPLIVTYSTSSPNEWSISIKFRIDAGVTLAGWLRKLLGELGSYSKTLVDLELWREGSNW